VCLMRMREWKPILLINCILLHVTEGYIVKPTLMFFYYYFFIIIFIIIILSESNEINILICNKDYLKYILIHLNKSLTYKKTRNV